MNKADLPNVLYKIIEDLGGSAPMIVIFRSFWKLHGKDLNENDDLFYTWNYDIRWAATELRKQGRMKAAHRTKKCNERDDSSKSGIWEIIKETEFA